MILLEVSFTSNIRRASNRIFMKHMIIREEKKIVTLSCALLLLTIFMISTVSAGQQTPFYAKLWSGNNGGPNPERMWLAGNSGNIMLRNGIQELIMNGSINGNVTFKINMNIFDIGSGNSGPTDGTVHIESSILGAEQSYTMNLNGRLVDSEIRGNFVIKGSNKKTIAVGEVIGRVDVDPVELIGKFV